MTDTGLAVLERRYLACLAKECRELGPEASGGAPVPLEGVFVLLQALRPQRQHSARPLSDLAPLAERGEHAGAREERSGAPPLPVPLSQALQAQRHLVLLGEPGAGKTTTLQFIALCFAQAGQAEAHLGLTEDRVPVRISLRELAPLLAAQPLPLALAPLVARIGRFDEGSARALLEEWGLAGRLLLLLDGLDELAEPARNTVTDEVRRFLADPTSRPCRVILSSRSVGYRELGAPFSEYYLCPFKDARDAEPFVVGWLASYRERTRAEVVSEAAAFLAELERQPGLRRILDNPLLLRMAVAVHVAHPEAPLERNRAGLYRHYLEDVAWERAQRRAAAPVARDLALRALRCVAWSLQAQQAQKPLTRSQLAAELRARLPEAQDATALLDYMRQPWGLLVAHGPEPDRQLAFAHLTFQEYLVAEHLAAAWQGDPRRAWRFLRPRLHASVWREPLRLLAAQLPAQEAVRLHAIVRRSRSPFERLLRRDRRLAVELACEASLFEPLLQALQDEDWWVRQMVAKALGRLGDARALDPLLQALRDKEELVCRSAVNALGQLGDARALDPLLQALQDESELVREVAAEALGQLGDAHALQPLWQALRDDEDVWVRCGAAEALGRLGDARALEPLQQALQDESDWVRFAVAEALGQLPDARGLEALLQALRDESIVVRVAALAALLRLGDAGMEALRQAPRDENMWARSGAAAEALGQLPDALALGPLRQALWDKYEEEYKAAEEAQRWLREGHALEPLLQTLRNEDRSVRWAAAQALGRLCDRLPDAAQVSAVVRALRWHPIGWQRLQGPEDEDAFGAALARLTDLQSAALPVPPFDELVAGGGGASRPSGWEVWGSMADTLSLVTGPLTLASTLLALAQPNTSLRVVLFYIAGSLLAICLLALAVALLARRRR